MDEATSLRWAGAQGRPVTTADTRVLEVPGALGGLLQGGIRRGNTMVISSPPGGVSLALTLAGVVTREGAWAAAVGLPTLGLRAAAELGVQLDRLALVPVPGDRWPVVAAALLDGMDLVLLGWPGRARPADARRLVARTREHGTVLVVLEPSGSRWPEAPDLRVSVANARWEGLGHGHGHLIRRRLEVVVNGRRAAARERRGPVWLPGGATDGSEPSAARIPRDPARIPRDPVPIARRHAVSAEVLMVRMLVAWYPDWPVVAAGCSPEVPAAVVRAHQVVAVTAAGRAKGVRPGLRRREAQGRCPELEVLPADSGREARAWEPVAVALEALTPAVEILAPGAAALATRGPSRYFGGDEALALRVAAEVDQVVGQPGCRVGVADGRFTAGLAARAAHPARRGPVTVVPAGSSPAWLAPHPVAALGSGFEALSDLLVRLGIRTLGDLAALPGPSVLGRFGLTGARARDLAAGCDDRLLAARPPPPDLAVAAELDPPAERIDTAAFVAKALADELHERLAALGLACTMVAIEAETDHGEQLVRRWRHEGALSSTALAERTRWQLDGWLMGGERPYGGLTWLRLVPEEVRPDNGRQLRFWGGEAAADARAARALARVLGMLGPEAVQTAVLAGGRVPAEQVRLVPWGDERPTVPPHQARRGGGRTPEVPPWPGRLVDPAPAVVYQLVRPVAVRDRAGTPVTVSGRGVISAPPDSVVFPGGRSLAVTGWAGPWPVEERWWDAGGRRQARVQVVLEDGTAHLLTREAGQWRVEAAYE